MEICRIIDEVRDYLNTPRENSSGWAWKMEQRTSLQRAGPFV